MVQTGNENQTQNPKSTKKKSLFCANKQLIL